MMYNLDDDADSSDEDVEENPAFGSEAELKTILIRGRQAAATAKARALSLFKRTEPYGNVDGAQYSYSVTISKTKAKLLSLTIR